SGDVLVAVTTLSFDIAALELYLPLMVGARLEIASRETAADGARLRELLAAVGATAMQATPVTWRLLLAAEWPGRERFAILCGGEALPAELAEELAERRGQLWNLYGPTETTVWSTLAGVLAGGGPITLGRAIANTEVYLLDRRLHPVPSGAAGELYLGGAGLSRGYLGRPALTAAGFVPHAFARIPGARLYRTGDLVRCRPDGCLEFLQRIDHQVKIRGFRIELGDVEAALGRHPGVRQAVVVARADRPDDAASKRLVAYLVAQGEPAPPAGALREFLRRRLPDYMLPAAYVFLPAFPLTASGKVDRRALPVPDVGRSELGEGFVGPRTPVEEMLAAIWGELLGLDRVGVHDSFFEIGGHSLLATQLLSRVRKAFQREVPVRRLFEVPTVAGLARELESDAEQAQAPPLVPVARQGDLPLSFAQQRLWVLNQLEPGDPAYNIPSAVRLRGRLELPALAAGLGEVVRRHESLRTSFAALHGKAAQVITAASPPALPEVDLRSLSPGARERTARALAFEEARRSFDLTRGPLLRTGLLRLAEDQHILLLTMHHIISDAWSAGVLLRELAALYEGFQARHRPRLPVLEIQYPDFAHWQRRWLRGEVLDRQLAYWTEQLADPPAALTLPTDRPRPAVWTSRGTLHRFRLPASLVDGLKRFSREQGATPYMTFLGALEALLCRYTGQQELCVGSPIANRGRSEIEGLIGFFVNTLVMRGDLRGDPSFRQLLERVRRAALGAYAHQDLPFEVLVEALTPERDLSRTPFFQVMFVLQNVPMPRFELPGLTLEPLEVDSGTAK
ncbi:MAG: AMP-binding protein, partial [bacterium]|nr:AMP-binding protein [bacterium]